jgi:hypothetical protein
VCALVWWRKTQRDRYMDVGHTDGHVPREPFLNLANFYSKEATYTVHNEEGVDVESLSISFSFFCLERLSSEVAKGDSLGLMRNGTESKAILEEKEKE